MAPSGLHLRHTVREAATPTLTPRQAARLRRCPAHCDYTATGAPRRLTQLGEAGIYSRLRHRMLTEEEVAELASGRFAFINVWRSIDDDVPCVMRSRSPCATRRACQTEDRFLYELRFPDRTGGTTRFSTRRSTNGSTTPGSGRRNASCSRSRQEGRRPALRLPHCLRRPDDARRRAAAQVHRGAPSFYDPPPLGIEDAEVRCQKADAEEWRGR